MNLALTQSCYLVCHSGSHSPTEWNVTMQDFAELGELGVFCAAWSSQCKSLASHGYKRLHVGKCTITHTHIQYMYMHKLSHVHIHFHQHLVCCTVIIHVCDMVCLLCPSLQSLHWLRWRKAIWIWEERKHGCENQFFLVTTWPLTRQLLATVTCVALNKTERLGSVQQRIVLCGFYLFAQKNLSQYKASILLKNVFLHFSDKYQTLPAVNLSFMKILYVCICLTE